MHNGSKHIASLNARIGQSSCRGVGCASLSTGGPVQAVVYASNPFRAMTWRYQRALFFQVRRWVR